MSHRGRALSIPEKQMIVNVKHYFDKEKELFLKNTKLEVNNSALRTALATHLSQVTVWRIMAEYHSNNSFSLPAKKGSRTYALPIRSIDFYYPEFQAANALIFRDKSKICFLESSNEAILVYKLA